MLRDGSGSDRENHRDTGEPAGMPAWLAGASCDLGMSALVRQQVIPRLVAAHAAPAEGASAAPIGRPGTPRLDPELVADIALAQDALSLVDRLEAALSAGATVDDLLVDALAPAARILGTRWEADLVDFVEVTMALWRLQEAVHTLSARRLPAAIRMSPTGRALCAVVPGDEHGFGSVLLEEMFVHAGWSAEGCRNASSAALLDHVRSSWFDVIALTASIDQPIGRLRELVAALRNASANPAVGILVGGYLFSANPGLAEAIGADATAEDGRAALALAATLVARRASPHDPFPSSHHGIGGDPALRAVTASLG
jgi:methanogenic corrinoid protein MtbC1